MKIPSYVTNLDDSYKKVGVERVRAFYDALYIAMVRYNIKHGKKNLSKQYMVKRIMPLVPEWYKKSFYQIYDINKRLYFLNNYGKI